MRLISWNVNGLRAIYKKGFPAWLEEDRPDVLCIQEVRAAPEELPTDLTDPPGYHAYYEMGDRPGYSGVAVLTREKPSRVERGIGDDRFDNEGRVLICDFDSFVLFNVYFPNGSASLARLDYKLEFYDAFLSHVSKLKQSGRSIVICGDVNTAHTEIDLARPRQNEHHSGFLPEERDWIDRLLAAGFIDTFRLFNKEGGNYTYWDFKTRARERNVGWRIDYFFVSEDLRERVTDAFILADVEGSDHCPIGLVLEGV